MNCNEIMVQSLRRLDRGDDNQTIDHYRAKFTQYMNRAVSIIARKYKPCRKETVTLSSAHTFSTDDLARACVKIVTVRAGGNAVSFSQDVDGSGTFEAATDAQTADVVYRFLPKKLSSTSDVPELPVHMHDMIVHYVVACERCGGDPETQSTASADFQLFNSALAEVESCKMGCPSAYKLVNY